MAELKSVGVTQLFYNSLCYRVWNPNTLSTFATVELRSSLLSLDWAPQSDSLVLIGSGDGVVGLYDSNSSKYHWDVKSDNRYPK